MYLAAVFSNGNVATGRHHGEAYCNLSCSDREGDLISGHLNPDGTFTTELDFLDKELILVRHAESEWNAKLSESLDSSLTFKGVSQAQSLAGFISDNIDCRGLVGYTSPFDRCCLTSMPIRRRTGIRFFVKPEVAELTDHFPEEGVAVPQRGYNDIEWGNYSKTVFAKESPAAFLGRLQCFLGQIPERALVVTHGSVVQTLVEMVLGVKVKDVPVWDNSIGNASVTWIKNGTVVLMAKNVV